MTATAWRSTRPPPLASAGTAWIDVFAEHGYNDILTLDDGRLRDIETDIVRGTGLRRLDPDGGTTLVSSPDPRREVFDGCPAIVVDAGDVSADGRGLSALINRWQRHSAEVVARVRAIDARASRVSMTVRRQVRQVAVALPDGTLRRQARRWFRTTLTGYATDAAPPSRAAVGVATPHGGAPGLAFAIAAGAGRAPPP